MGVGAATAGQHDLAGCSLALVAYHHYVIAGTFQKLGDYVASLTGTISAKDALIGG